MPFLPGNLSRIGRVFLAFVFVLAAPLSGQAQENPAAPAVYSIKIAYRPAAPGDSPSAAEIRCTPSRNASALASIWIPGFDRWSVEINVDEKDGYFFCQITDPKSPVLITGPDNPPLVRDSVLCQTSLPLKLNEEITVLKTDLFSLTLLFKKEGK